MSDPSISRDRLTCDIAVLGGGVVGLATAFALSRTSAKVMIFDRAGSPGAEASGAAAGIVSTLYPWEAGLELQTLADESVRMYEDWCQELTERSGMDTGWWRCGLMSLDDGQIEAACGWARDHGRSVDIIGPEAIKRRVAGIHAPCERAIWLPDAASVTPGALLRALAGACGQAGVEMVWDCPVRALRVEHGRVIGAETVDGRSIRAGETVVATGAWASELLTPVGLNQAIRPVRGQIVEIQAPPGTLECMVMRQHRYLVPRRDGRILVGSSAEEAGFDRSTTQPVRAQLLEFACGLVPGLAALPVTGHWAGLRPASPGGAPIVGPATGLAGLWLNIGHFRNGITLAPAAAARLAAELDRIHV